MIDLLTRTKKEATTIELSLAAAGIACYHPDNDVLSFREVRALIAWTRVALDENDRLALVLAMSTPDCGLTAAAIEMFVDMARDKGISLAQTLREAMTSGHATAGGPSERFMTNLDSVTTMRFTETRE